MQQNRLINILAGPNVRRTRHHAMLWKSIMVRLRLENFSRIVGHGPCVFQQRFVILLILVWLSALVCCSRF